MQKGPATVSEEYEILRDLGLLAWTSDRMDESHRYLARAAEIALKNGWTKQAADCQAAEQIRESYLQGIKARNSGAPKTSERFFKVAAELAESIRSPGYLLKALRGWSIIYLGTPARSEFKALNERALEAARAFHHGEEIFNSLHYLGGHYFANSAYSFALCRYLEALSQARMLADDRSSLICLNAIAAAFSTLGDHSRAIEYYSEALRISRGGRAPFITGTILGDLADVHRRIYKETGNLEEARRALDGYRQALAEFMNSKSPESPKNDERARIGNILVDLGQPGEALAGLRAAVESSAAQKNPELSAAFAIDLGRALLAAGDAPRAAAEFARVLTVPKKEGFLIPPAKAHFGLALCGEKKGDFAGALAHCRAALDIVRKLGEGIGEDLHSAEFASDWDDLYEKIIDLCFMLAEKSSASSFRREIFQVVEIAKSITLFRPSPAERAAHRLAANEQANLDPEALRTMRNDALKALASKELKTEERSKHEFELRQIEDMLTASNGKMVPGMISLSGPAAVETIQKNLLDARTALIEFWLGRDRSYGLVMTRESFEIVELPSAGRIEESISGYLGFLSNPEIPAAAGQAGGERIYREIFAPLTKLLPLNMDRLIIVPDSTLNGLPFEALRVPAADGRNAGYLLDLYTVTYAPSATSLLGSTRSPMANSVPKSIFAIGASEYPKPSIPQDGLPASPSQIMAVVYADKGFVPETLPNVRKEIAAVARHFPKDRIRTILGSSATESAFKTAIGGDHAIVHIASHALSDEADPMRSAIVFSPERSGGEDGFFQLRELEGSGFSADLAVFSGCRTAGGKRAGHSGVMGLAREMFRLGAHAVVSSIWKAEDRATALFMEAFYTAWGGIGRRRGRSALGQKENALHEICPPLFLGGIYSDG